MIRRLNESSFTLKRVQEMIGLSRTTVSRLIAKGFVKPDRGPRNELLFSFQDLTLLRMAKGLERALIPPQRILKSLATLRSELPPELPLSGLRITAVGSDVVVRERAGHRHVETGQLVIDFDHAPEPDCRVRFLRIDAPEATRTAANLFRQAAALEEMDPAAAEQAYHEAIDLDPKAVDPYLNLGALLCESQRYAAAVDLYQQAVQQVPDHAGLYFNQALALEDQQLVPEAIAAYQRALTIDPSLADAHYNAARLYHQVDDFQGALRHFSAYRRLQKGKRS